MGREGNGALWDTSAPKQTSIGTIGRHVDLSHHSGRQTTAAGWPKIDFQRTRASKTDPCSRYYAPTDFHIVAGCLHAVTEEWEFRYIEPARLEPRASCPGKLDNKVIVDGRWTKDAGVAFEAAYARVGFAV
jgi:hypothetical protein